MRDEPPSPTFPPPETLTASLRATVLDAAVAALADLVPEATARARLEGPFDAALRAHVTAVEDRLLRAERLASAGRLTAGVAHELRNPLAVMETSVFILQERHTGDERTQRQLRRISEQIALASAIVDDALDAVRARPLERAPLDLASVAHDAAGRVPRPTGVTLALELPTGVATTRGDARRLGQVVVNLVANAVQAVVESAGAGRTVEVRVARDGDDATLTVDDDGPGIDPALAPRLFDPLVSTRATGTGLGLALSRAIAEEHGGTLAVEARRPRGARFTLRLPYVGAP